jgi:hypothetical protein
MGILIVEVLSHQETVGYDLTSKVLISPMGTQMEVVIHFDLWIGGIDHFYPLDPIPQKRG